MVVFVFFILSCSNGQREKKPILFDPLALPCDMVQQQELAKFLEIMVVDIIFQNVKNTATQKICTYYKNVQPKTIPLINLTVEPVQDVKTSHDLLLEELVKNGISGSEGISKFKKIPDDRFKAVSSSSNSIYNQIFLSVESKALVIIEYDKTLVKNGDIEEFERKLIELYLYKGPHY